MFNKLRKYKRKNFKLVKDFNKLIDKLREQSYKVEEERILILEKIELMEKECKRLKELSDSSRKLAYDISNIIDEH